MLRNFFSSAEENAQPMEANVHTRLAADEFDESSSYTNNYPESQQTNPSSSYFSQTFQSMSSSLGQGFQSLRSGNGNGGEQGTEEENQSLFPHLSYQTRFNGFLSCFIAGFVLSFFSSFTLMTGNLIRFAFVYTIGNLVGLLGTIFLIGPERQLKKMFDETRYISSSVYLAALTLTVVFALLGRGVFVVLPLVVIQWCAGIWYTASYVPYGRSAVKGFVNSVTGLQL